MAKYHYKRLFRGISDSLMLMKAQTIHDLFVDYIDDFEARYPDLNLGFASNFQTLINIAYSAGEDKGVRSEISTLQANLSRKWKQCRDVFNDLRYFIERAFPNNKAMWIQFGYSEYRNMARSHIKVPKFMDLLHGALEKYKTELMAVDLTQAQIDYVLEVKNQFVEAQKAQHVFLKSRPEFTQTRVTKLNNVWMTLKRINKASKRVYMLNYAGLQMFLLPAAVSNEMGSLTLTGVVFDLQTSEPIADAKVEIPELNLQTKTDENGKFGFARKLPRSTATLRVEANGFEVNVQPIKTYKSKKQTLEIGLNSNT